VSFSVCVCVCIYFLLFININCFKVANRYLSIKINVFTKYIYFIILILTNCKLISPTEVLATIK